MEAEMRSSEAVAKWKAQRIVSGSLEYFPIIKISSRPENFLAFPSSAFFFGKKSETAPAAAARTHEKCPYNKFKLNPNCVCHYGIAPYIMKKREK